MTRLEMVEKIKEKTGVSYEEARETLEKSNWDMLDAIVALERANMASGEYAQYAQPAPEPEPETKRAEKQQAAPKKRVVRRSSGGELGDKVAYALRWLGVLIQKGDENKIEVARRDEPVMSVSLTVLVLLFLVNWWIPTLLIVLGLFTGYKFRFKGGLLAGKIVNSAAEKASSKADELKNKLNDAE